MPRPTWANDAQTAFLTERKKGFTDAQAKSTSRSFLNATTEAFLERWPVEPPTAMEIGEEDGDAEAAKDKKLKKWQKRVEHWLRNHTRVNPSGATNAKTAVLSLAPKKTQLLLPYQAYMCLFRERVMSDIRTRFNTYKATLSQDDQPRGWWSFAIEQAGRMLKEEPEDVKAQVDEFRRRNLQKMKAEYVDIAKLEEMGADEAAQRVHALQQAINLLPRTGQEALKAIQAQTGFYGVLLVGGPNPETGRLVTLAIHNGRTVELKNIFSDASEEWPVVQNAFDHFIGRCFDPTLPVRLEKVYRGETPATAPATPSAPPTSTPTGTSDAVEIQDASPPPRICKQSSSIPELEPEPDYDEQRSKNIARNAIIMKRLLDGENMEAILESIDEDLPEDQDPEWLMDGLPEWVEEALGYLKGVCEEEWWIALLDEWVAFERGLQFPDGQTQRNWLATKGRPEEVKYWIGRGRQYDKPPKIKSTTVFATTWWKWWARLQPAVRRSENEVNYPLARELPQEDEEWSKVRRGGWNGLFMVIMCLSWWIHALDEDDFADVQKAAEDVKWACIAMTEPGRLDTDPAAPNLTTPIEPAKLASVPLATVAPESILKSNSAPTSIPPVLVAPAAVSSESPIVSVAPPAAVAPPAIVASPAAIAPASTDPSESAPLTTIALASTESISSESAPPAAVAPASTESIPSESAPLATIAPASTESIPSESAPMSAVPALSMLSGIVPMPASALPSSLPPAITTPESVVPALVSQSCSPAPLDVPGPPTELSHGRASDASALATSSSVLTASTFTPAPPVPPETLSRTVAHVLDSKRPLGPPGQVKEKQEDAHGAPLVGGIRSEGAPDANSVETLPGSPQQDVVMFDVSPTIHQGAVSPPSTSLTPSFPMPTIALAGELLSVSTSVMPCPKSPVTPGSPPVKRTNVDIEDLASEQVTKKARIE